MSIWLKQRLAVWMGVSLLCGALLWNGGALWAQDDAKWAFSIESARPKLTRDEAAKKFVAFMNDKDHSYGLLGACVSRKSRVQLGNGALRLVDAMTEQWRSAQKSVRVQSQTKESAVVVVKQSPTDLPLILIKENGGWGVDLIETYAKWNNLQGVAKAKAIYKISGAVLAELPQDENFKRSQCQSNLKWIALSLLQYTQDYDEKLPPAKNWVDVLQPYAKNQQIFNCPALPKGARNGYAFNARLSGVYEPDFLDTSKTVSLYETTILKRNAYGLGENRAFRHMGGANYAFADGHVTWFPKTQTPSFNLKP